MPAPKDVLAKRFRVESVLGEGGMGMVYGARLIQTNAAVAIKVLSAEASAQADAIPRFLNEARATMQLLSPNAVKIFEVGTLEDYGLPYIVMEMLEGSDLANLIERRGSLPIAEACDYVIQASAAVAEAHALGIVHRDLKPSNLFLATKKTANGEPGNVVKVLDFGISKMTGSSGGVRQAAMTATGAFLGSPHYMPPEQLKSAKDVDPRADIWSMGVILYELLTGKPPFDGGAYGELFLKVMSGEFPPLRAVKPKVPEDLEKIVIRCLKKNRDERFANLGEMTMALAPFASPDGKARAKRIGAGNFGPISDPNVSLAATAPDESKSSSPSPSPNPNPNPFGAPIEEPDEEATVAGPMPSSSKPKIPRALGANPRLGLPSAASGKGPVAPRAGAPRIVKSEPKLMSPAAGVPASAAAPIPTPTTAFAATPASQPTMVGGAEPAAADDDSVGGDEVEDFDPRDEMEHTLVMDHGAPLRGVVPGGSGGPPSRPGGHMPAPMPAAGAPMHMQSGMHQPHNMAPFSHSPHPQAVHPHSQTPSQPMMAYTPRHPSHGQMQAVQVPQQFQQTAAMHQPPPSFTPNPPQSQPLIFQQPANPSFTPQQAARVGWHAPTVVKKKGPSPQMLIGLMLGVLILVLGVLIFILVRLRAEDAAQDQRPALSLTPLPAQPPPPPTASVVVPPPAPAPVPAPPPTTTDSAAAATAPTTPPPPPTSEPAPTAAPAPVPAPAPQPQPAPRPGPAPGSILDKRK